jgi:hypothetical protein
MASPGGFPVAQCGLGTAYATYTTAKSIIPTTAVYSISANNLYVGKRYRISAWIALSNIVTAQPTFTFQVMGGPTSNIIVWQSGALVATTTAHTSIPCFVQVDLKCATIGSGTTANYAAIGQVKCIALVYAGAVADPTAEVQTMICPNAAYATPSSGAAGFNSTVLTKLDFWCGIGTSDAANGVQIFDYLVEDMNGP